MSDENELDKLGGFILVSPRPPFFRHAGRGVVVAVGGVGRHHPLLVVCFLSYLPCRPVAPLVSRAVVVSSCLACSLCLSCGCSSGASVVSACYPFRVLSSYRSAPRSFDNGGGGGGGLRLSPGSPRSLLPVACRGGAVDVAGRFLSGAARCRRVDGVGWLRDFRRFRCLSLVILSGWRVSLVPSRCLLRSRCRRGSSWADCHLVLPSWLRLVVGHYGPSSSRLACPRMSLSSVFAPCAASAVDRFVDRSAASRPVLLVGEAGRLAVRALSSRAARCLGVVLLSTLAPVMVWRLVLSACLLAVSVSCGGVAAVEEGQLGNWCAACLPCLNPCGGLSWASRACVSLFPDTHFAPSPL